MHDLNLAPGRKHRKCAKIAGDTSGNYHPHGEAVIYPTLVNMGQNWKMRVMLVDKQGNFGSIDGDPPAAMRYTEARMTQGAVELLDDLKLDTVDFKANYDETREEPTVLPGRLPNLLLNGSSGIAVGMACSSPPHNVREILDAIVACIDNPQITFEDLVTIVQGPDFPTGGVIAGKGGILPREKITKEIAEIRLVEMGKDVISPPRHREWEDAEGMCLFIGRLQKLTGKPIGIKFCLGDPAFLDETCRAIQKTGFWPDYMAVDSAEGGTGAAPLAHTNLLGYPLLDAVMITENKLIEYGLRDQIRICASGKIWTGGSLAVVLAAGADFAASARGFMLSIGCIQALHCNTNFCPSGVATQKKWLQRGLVPSVNGPRVANYQHAVLHEFNGVLGSCGHNAGSELSRKDLMRIVGWHDIRPMNELVPYPKGKPGGAPPSAEDSADSSLPPLDGGI